MEQLAPIPIDVGMKSPAILGGDAAQLRSETCELCKMAVAKANEFIGDPTNDVSLFRLWWELEWKLGCWILDKRKLQKQTKCQIKL